MAYILVNTVQVGKRVLFLSVGKDYIDALMYQTLRLGDSFYLSRPVCGVVIIDDSQQGAFSSLLIRASPDVPTAILGRDFQVKSVSGGKASLSISVIVIATFAVVLPTRHSTRVLRDRCHVVILPLRVLLLCGTN